MIDYAPHPDGVHNHGPHGDPGTTCPEYIIGRCRATPSSARAVDMAGGGGDDWDPRMSGEPGLIDHPRLSIWDRLGAKLRRS